MPHQVYRSGEAVQLPPDHRFDYIVCAKKNTGDCISTLHDISPLVHPGTTLVAAQNGMDVELPLLQAFPKNTVLSVICNIGCSQVSPGLVEQTTRIQRSAFLIGLYGRNQVQNRTDATRRDALVSMDPQFASIECAARERWLKLIFNSAINSTTALTGLNVQQLLEQPGAAKLVTRLANEAYLVGVASGIELDAGVPAKVLELAWSSGPLTPSTLQDVRKGRPLELSPIFGKLNTRDVKNVRTLLTNTGYLVSQAAKVGVSIPYMTWVHALLQKKSRGTVTRQAPGEASWHTYHLSHELPTSSTSSELSFISNVDFR